MKPQLLDSEPEDIEPVFYTHFDCWSDFGHEDSAPLWEWNNPKAVALVEKLCQQWREVLGPDIVTLARTYLELGQIQFFERAAQLFVQAGYCVYDSDTRFEVYDTKQLTEQEAAAKQHCFLTRQSDPKRLADYRNGFDLNAEHLSGPNGCAEDCDACAREKELNGPDAWKLDVGAECNQLLDFALGIEQTEGLCGTGDKECDEKTVKAIRSLVARVAEFEALETE